MGLGKWLWKYLIAGVEGRLKRLEQKDKIQTQIIKVNRQNIELIMQHIPELNKLKLHASIPPQDEYSLVSGDEYEDEEDDVKDLKCGINVKRYPSNAI